MVRNVVDKYRPGKKRRKDHDKDREYTIELGEGVELLCRRSTELPITYAFLLRVDRGIQWEVVLCIDNSHERHDVDTHHLHHYIEGMKQEAESLPFPTADTNDAMEKAIAWVTDNWESLVQ